MTLQGNAFDTTGHLPKVGTKAPNFTFVEIDLSETVLVDYTGTKLILNIFPSEVKVVYVTSIRTFNQKVSDMDNNKVLCVSADLPFAAARFCGVGGIENVAIGSGFK